MADRRRELLSSWTTDFLLAHYAEFEAKLEGLASAARVLEEGPDDPNELYMVGRAGSAVVGLYTYGVED